MAQIFQALLLGSLISKSGGKKLGNLSSKPNQEDLVRIRELIEAGEVVPVIDSCYQFDEIAEAVRHYGEGHARGKVVITLAHNGQ